MLGTMHASEFSFKKTKFELPILFQEALLLYCYPLKWSVLQLRPEQLPLYNAKVTYHFYLISFWIISRWTWRCFHGGHRKKGAPWAAWCFLSPLLTHLARPSMTFRLYNNSWGVQEGVVMTYWGRPPKISSWIPSCHTKSAAKSVPKSEGS